MLDSKMRQWPIGSLDRRPVPSLDGGKCFFGDVISTSVTYHPILIVSSFLAFLHLPAHVRNNGVDVCNDDVDVFNIVMNVRNGGIYVFNTAMNIRNECMGLRDGYVRVYRKLSLGKNI